MQKYIIFLFICWLSINGHLCGQTTTFEPQFIFPSGQTCSVPIENLKQSQYNINANTSTIPPRLRVAYIIASNRTPQVNGIANLQNMVMYAQAWYKENMKVNGFGEKTFDYEKEPNTNKPKVNVVNSPNTDTYLRGNNNFDVYGRAIEAAQQAGLTVGAQNEIWFIVSESHIMNPNGSTLGGCALGIGGGSGSDGGACVIGSNWLPFFSKLTDDTFYNGQILPELGPYPMVYNVTYSEVDGTTFSSAASSFMGGVCHELGHAFGLAHDFRNDAARNGNVMHNGFRGIRGSLYPSKYPTEYMRLAYNAALYLNTSHYFNPKLLNTTRPSVSISTSSPALLNNGLLTISFSASDSDTLVAAFLRFDGNEVNEMALNTTSITSQFVTPYFDLTQSKEYLVVVRDKQGNLSASSINLSVQQNGSNQAPKPYIETIEHSPKKDATVLLKSVGTSDANDAIFTLQVQWDLNNDNIYDTGWLNAANDFSTTFVNAGNYLIKAKIKDPVGAETVSTPISLRVTDTNGDCRYIMPPIISGSTSVCAGTTTTLNANGCPGIIKWSDSSTGTQLTVTPYSSVTYSVFCEYANGCQSQSTSFQIAIIANPSNLATLEVFNTSALLTWTGESSSYTIEYRQVGTNTWLSGGTATTNVKNITGLSPNTNYEWHVRGDCVDFSSMANFSTNTSNIHCVPNYSVGCNGFGIGLDGFIIGTNTLSSGSGCSSQYYSFNYNNPINLVSGQNYNFNLIYLGNYNGIQSSIWIDLNKNNTFEPAEKLFSTTTAALGNQLGNFTIPLNTSSKKGIRMRVITNFISTPTDPCGTYGYGEAEDYLVNICSTLNTPTLNLSGTQTLCPNGSINLIASGCSDTIIWSNGSTGSTLTVNLSGTYAATCTNLCGASASSSQVIVISMPPTQDLSGIATNGLIQAGQITSTQTVNAGITTSYRAGNSVLLNPTFQVQLGAIFKAETTGCN